MRVSIVTISFNQGQFLETAIKSVIEQNYNNLEYIIVDAGSTDKSRDIIHKYAGYFSKVILEPDNGPADGLNKGFKCATGEIFGFLNADDFLLPKVISQVTNMFKKEPNADVVSGHAIVVNEDGTLLRKIYSRKFSILEYAYSSAFIIQPSTFFTAQTYTSTKGFNIKNRVHWDGELFVEMMLQKRNFVIINAPLSAYRVHKLSLTGSANNQFLSLSREYRKLRFERIMKRKENSMDILLQQILRLYKLIANPRDTYERIFHGPVLGRAQDK